MKRLVLLWIAVAAARCTDTAQAFEVRGNAVILTPAEVEQCKSGGGCLVMTKAQLDAAVDALMREAAQMCRRGTV